MKVLIIGGGAREHALAWKLKQSPLLSELFCAPGNAGTGNLGVNVELKSENTGALALWAVENEIALTVVGAETPVAEGIADIFAEHGLRIFAPGAKAAQLGSSQIFARETAVKAGLRVPHGEVFDSLEKAKAFALSIDGPVVLKAESRRAKRRTTIAFSSHEAIAALEELMVRQGDGNEGRILIEEFVEGPEVSVMALTDSSTVLPLVIAGRLRHIERGPQGGAVRGAGAVSPTAAAGDKRVENLVGEIFIPVLRELHARGIKYTGFLYANIVIGPQGEITVVEFKTCLGDPEAEAVLLRLQSDLLYALDAAVRGKLSSIDLQWKTDSAVSVVLESADYEGAIENRPIEGLFAGGEELQVFQEHTALDAEGRTVIAGGKVAVVGAVGPNLKQAGAKAYRAIETLKFEGLRFRDDIGDES